MTKPASAVAMIPARIGSERLPKKNLVMVNGEPMQVFRIGLLKGAAKIVMVHNHPGKDIPFGDLKPSARDDDVTDRMIRVGTLPRSKLPSI